NAAFAVELRAAHFCATEAAGGLDAYTLCSCTKCSLETFTHGAAERDTSSELLGNALCDELCIGFRVFDLEDVQLNLFAGELFKFTANAFSFGTATADDNPGTSRVNVNTDTVAGALDLDA